MSVKRHTAAVGILSLSEHDAATGGPAREASYPAR
jgi:hypothetical protein